MPTSTPVDITTPLPGLQDGPWWALTLGDSIAIVAALAAMLAAWFGYLSWKRAAEELKLVQTDVAYGRANVEYLKHLSRKALLSLRFVGGAEVREERGTGSVLVPLVILNSGRTVRGALLDVYVAANETPPAGMTRDSQAFEIERTRHHRYFRVIDDLLFEGYPNRVCPDMELQLQPGQTRTFYYFVVCEDGTFPGNGKPGKLTLKSALPPDAANQARNGRRLGAREKSS
jgi:hypothetical protein